MPAPSVTYTFINGTTADATQVNTNFTDLINGASDGTKDYTLNSATLNGNLSFAGNGTFGSASGDDLTFNASLASSIPVKTNATYDIGGATTGLAGVYFGNNTRSIRMVAGVITTTYTFTLPVAAPTKTGMVMTFDTNALATFRYTNKLTATKTTTYVATSDETVIPCDATSGAFTVTLPAASGNSGLTLTIIKIDSSLANAVTIEGDGSETINGALNTTLNTQYESVTVMCNGSNWLIWDRRLPSVSTAYTPTLTGFGTPSSVSFFWQRIGDSIDVWGSFVCGTNTATVAKISLPTGLAVATTKVSGSQLNILGEAYRADTSGTNFPVIGRGPYAMTYSSSDANACYFSGNVDQDNGVFSQINGSALANTGDRVTLKFKMPISGWDA